MATGQYIGINGVARKVTAPYIGVNGVARNVKSGYVGVNGVARLFFAPESGKVVLEVKKVTSDTYANETQYTAEEFILLDIYPKPGGTVNVTYGGLTKTITDTSGAEEPNAQKVFFGTFNGVSDSVETPASGELMIEGDFFAFGCSSFIYDSKSITKVCGCVTAIGEFGSITKVPAKAFSGCGEITSITIPKGATTIGSGAFHSCAQLSSLSIPNTVRSIGDPSHKDVYNDNTFVGCQALDNIEVDSGNKNYTSENGVLYSKDKTVLISYPTAAGAYEIPSGVTIIHKNAFSGTALTSLTIPSTVTLLGSALIWECTSLANIYILATTPPELGNNSLILDASANKPTITVPKGCGETYKTATGWVDYADYIVEAS